MNRSLGHPRVAVLFLLLSMLILCASPAHSQSDLEKALQQFSGDQVSGYLQPLSDLFGANMNSGYFHSAAIPTVGLTLKVELVAMGGLVGDKQKSYTAKAPAGFNPSTFSTATVFGGTGSTVTDANTHFTFRGSDGVFNTPIFPFATPQIRVGSIFGTEAVIRYVSSDWFETNKKFPKATILAVGVQHNVSQYLPMVPLDLAGGITYSHLTFGDLLSLKGFSLNARASKTILILTLYGGLSWESSSLNVKYTPASTTFPPVNIDLSSANSVRATLGFQLSLAIVNIFADASFASVTSFSGGIGFGI